MRLTHLDAAVLLGFVLPQISGFTVSSTSSDCLAALDNCMSDLCKNEKAFTRNICEGEACQIKGSQLCNMTIHAVLEQFPSLRGCLCAWEEEPCDSIQELVTRCHRKPAAEQKRSTAPEWQSSSLIGYVHDAAGSCLEQMRLCLRDAVCNRRLAPVLQVCMGERCDRDLCLRAIQHFYGSMPHDVADMLAMCECDPSDQSCQHMKTVLHGGSCEDETRVCQETVSRCVEDRHCRDTFINFRTKCWNSDEAQYSDVDLRRDSFAQMDPALILGGDFECKMAFMATFGTALHYPCTCKQVQSADLLTCKMIHDVLHNRSHFSTAQRRYHGPSKPPETSEAEEDQTSVTDYLLYAFATLLLVGIVVLMPLIVMSKMLMLRRKDKARFHPPQKSNCVVIL